MISALASYGRDPGDMSCLNAGYEPDAVELVGEMLIMSGLLVR
jgi:hypothetical protein